MKNKIDLDAYNDIESGFNHIDYSFGNGSIAGYSTDRISLGKYGIWIITNMKTKRIYYLNIDTMVLGKSFIKSRFECTKFYWKKFFKMYLKFALPVLAFIYGLLNIDLSQYIHVISNTQWTGIQSMLKITYYIMLVCVFGSVFTMKDMIREDHLTDLEYRLKTDIEENQEGCEDDGYCEE